MKIAIPEKHSNRESARGRERASYRRRWRHLAAIEEHIHAQGTPEEIAGILREITQSYLELSMHALMEIEDYPTLKLVPHADVLEHVCYLTELVRLFEVMSSKR